MVDELADFWIHDTTIHAPADLYGNPGTPRPQKGWVSRKQRMVINRTGAEQASSARVSYPPGTAISLDELVSIPGEATPRSIIAIAVADSGTLELPDRVIVSLT